MALPSMMRASVMRSGTSRRSAALAEISRQVENQEVLDEPDDEDKYHRRDVDPAEVRKNAADRPQRRLGHAVEEIAQEVDEAVAGVDHVERDQPAQDDPDDEDPLVERKKSDDQEQQGFHSNPVYEDANRGI